MPQNVLNIFLRVRESFDELNDRVSLLKTYFELHISSPGIAKTLEEFEKLLGFKPELIYRAKENVYGISIVYTIEDDITKGIIAHEFAELVAREKGISNHEAIDQICVEKGFGQELLLALESVLPGRAERAFIDLADLKTRINRLRGKIEKNES
jgi:hypothetical protein